MTSPSPTSPVVPLRRALARAAAAATVALAVLATAPPAPGAGATAAGPAAPTPILEAAPLPRPAGRAARLLADLRRARRAGDRDRALALEAARGAVPDSLLATSPRPGLAAPAPAAWPGLAAAPGAEPGDDLRIDPAGTGHRRPRMAAQADGTLWVVAEDAEGPGLDLFRSADHGRTWALALSIEDTRELSRPVLAVGEGAADRLLVACERDAGGDRSAIRLLWFDLDGTEAGEALIVPPVPGPTVGRPGLCVDSPEYDHWYPYLVFAAGQADGGTRIVLSRSLDQGRTWCPPRSLLEDVPADVAPDPDFGEQTLHVVGTIGENRRDVWLLRSADYGQTWSAPSLLAAGEEDESQPRVAAANGPHSVVVALTRSLPGGGSRVEALVSRDAGATWTGGAVSGLSTAARLPAVTASRERGHLYVAWLDGRTVREVRAPADLPARWSVPFGISEGGGALLDAPPCPAVDPTRLAEAIVVWGDDRLSPDRPSLRFDRGAWAAARVTPAGDGDYPDIQSAILDAPSASEVVLAPGVFRGPGNVDLDLAGRAVVLRGESPEPGSSVIDCAGTPLSPHRAFRFRSGEGPETTLRNLTVTGGYAAAAGPGGGLGGGALLEDGAAPSFEAVLFRDNVAERGGGAVACLGGPVPFGLAPAPRFELCRFERNLTDGDGAGALHCEGPLAPAIRLSIFLANRSAGGAGAVQLRGDVGAEVRRCTLALNEGGAAGGILVEAGATAQVSRTIVALGERGAALGCGSGGTATLSCCDLFGNAGGDWVGCVAEQLGDQGNIGLDPRFCDLAAGVLSLSAGSPCLPSGNPCEVLLGVYGAACFTVAGRPGAPAPSPLALRAAPNPFNPRTVLSFRLPTAGPTRLAVHDLAGRRLALLLDRELPAGPHEVAWEGRDDRGRALPSGCYLARLEAAGRQRTTRLLLLR